MAAKFTQKTEQILAHHMQAFGKGDANDVISDYTEESTLFTPDGAAHGKAEIKSVFEGLFQEIFPPESTKLEISQQIVEGETAYIVWSGESAGYKFELGTDTFTVRNGKILNQTFAGKIVPKKL